MARMKRSVIHGLAACCFVLLVFGAGPAWAVPTGTIAIEQETDKTVYQLGEEVALLYRVGNYSECMCAWHLYQMPGFGVWAFENSDNLGRDELLTSHEPIGPPAPPFIEQDYSWVFEPEEVIEMDGTWDLTDYYGNPVAPGEYELVAIYYGTYDSSCDAPLDLTNAQAHIIVIPEPSMLVLLAGSGMLLARRKLMGGKALRR